MSMSNGHNRRKAALDIRREAAELAFHRAHPNQSSNGDENRFANYIGNYTKGLPHNSTTGEVDPPAAYQALLESLRSEVDDDFQMVPVPSGLSKRRKLVNPRAGLAFDLEGADSAAVAMPPAPAVDSAQAAGEAVELYWMALLRDVPFTDYATHALAQDAVADLNNLSDFRGPKIGDQVTAQTLFRGATPGELIGPYISQFLLLDIPFGTLTVGQRQTTVKEKTDWMTSWGAWLAVQNGEDTSGTDQFDDTPRYIRNGRDLATYVHFDALYEAYLNACLILLAAKAPFDVGMPYRNSQRQEGFGTFGGPHILSLVTEVATRALKAVWRQKWQVHRRLRPEAYGGLVHRVMMDNAPYPVHTDVSNSQVLAKIESEFSSYLLPMAFPEGSPMHPAYGAGHATVAGACTTVLKAWFDEAFPITQLTLPIRPGQLGPALGNPKVPDAPGTGLIDYAGADKDQLTVGGELNKVAANVAIGRNHAGVHWYTDYSESLRLGEEIAIGILEEQALTYREGGTFTLTPFRRHPGGHLRPHENPGSRHLRPRSPDRGPEAFFRSTTLETQL
jgi:hypothetical protein